MEEALVLLDDADAGVTAALGGHAAGAQVAERGEHEVLGEPLAGVVQLRHRTRLVLPRRQVRLWRGQNDVIGHDLSSRDARYDCGEDRMTSSDTTCPPVTPGTTVGTDGRTDGAMDWSQYITDM